MINSYGTSQKFNVVLENPGTVGVLATATPNADGTPKNEFAVHAETRIRCEYTGTSTVLLEARIIGSSTWTAITLTSGVGDISTYDYIRFRVSVGGTAGTVTSSGFLSFI